MQMALIDTGCKQCITLKIDRLTIVGCRHAHIAYKHDELPRISDFSDSIISVRVFRTETVLFSYSYRYLAKGGEKQMFSGTA